MRRGARGATEAFLVVPAGAIFRLDENGSKRRAPTKAIENKIKKEKLAEV
jgi:hypothetical protein